MQAATGRNINNRSTSVKRGASIIYRIPNITSSSTPYIQALQQQPQQLQ